SLSVIVSEVGCSFVAGSLRVRSRFVVSSMWPGCPFDVVRRTAAHTWPHARSCIDVGSRHPRVFIDDLTLRRTAYTCGDRRAPCGDASLPSALSVLTFM